LIIVIDKFRNHEMLCVLRCVELVYPEPSLPSFSGVEGEQACLTEVNYSD